MTHLPSGLVQERFQHYLVVPDAGSGEVQNLDYLLLRKLNVYRVEADLQLDQRHLGAQRWVNRQLHQTVNRQKGVLLDLHILLHGLDHPGRALLSEEELLLILRQRLPVYFEVFDVHDLEDGLFYFAFLPLYKDRLPVLVCGAEGEGFKGNSEAVAVELVGLLETDVDVFDLKFEVVNYLFPQFVKHAFFFVGLLHLAHE